MTTGQSKKKSNRCVVCNKKLGLLPFVCKCEGLYCTKHRHPEDHNCTFNHKEKLRNILENTLIKVEADKVKNRV